jgi:hypothetical protein
VSNSARDRLRGLAEASEPGEILRGLRALRRELEEYERQQVARALTAGASFATIARELGVSRQAAHRRFRALAPSAEEELSGRPPPTPEVKLALEYARAERSLPAGQAVLIAVLRIPDLPAAALLRDAGVTLEAARGVAGEPPQGEAELRALLAGAGREALRTDHRRVEVEHLLLAALRNPAGGATRALHALGVSPDGVRESLQAVLAPWL